MAITAAMVKELREMTGAGMMDCKKALTETDGDMDKAVDYLREKGLAGAEKKAGRIAAEGIVATAVCPKCGKKAVIVEVNAETDFVAKNEKFTSYVAEVADQLLKSDVQTVEEFLEEKWALDPSMTVKEKLSSMISVIGENMNIRRFARMNVEEGTVASYIHAGGKIGVLVKVESDVVNDAVAEMGRNICMQAAALRPRFCSNADVPADFIAKETEILKAQIENDPKEAAKPEQVKMGMIKGRINKELKELCLLDQVYVKAEDGKQTVSQYIAQVAKENGANIKVTSFLRFETGEGLEKRNEDFAAEVAKQMGK
ncbi:MAG: elongation factor Ts [Lachnospiraceae bacterium]|nr:elongation factor Ts [Lachnospiraceae bacterium]